MNDAQGSQVEATSQLERARGALGEALGLVQDLHGTGLDVDEISATLAAAVREIFELQNSGVYTPGGKEFLDRASERLSMTLGLMQEVPGEQPSLVLATGTIARTLAILYPISKSIERFSAPPPPPSEAEPLPLTAPTEAAPVPEEEPVPLTLSQPAASAPEPEPQPIPLAAPAATEPADEPVPLTGGRERRVAPRRRIEVEMGMQSGTNFFTGFSQDISAGGLFVSTYDIHPVGTTINVNFEIPGRAMMSLDGAVQWVREYNDANPDMEPGMGLRFVDLDAEDREAINRYIAANPPIFYEED